VTGVPHHSKDYIERRTESTLRSFVLAALTEAQPTPLGDIAARVSEQLGATFHFDQELGLTSQGQKILGACYFEPAFAIFVDPSLQSADGSARFRFTLAHELGHLSLHRNLRLDFQSLDATARAIVDGERDLQPGPRELITPRDFLEWQANSYAAALLMPRVTVRSALALQQLDMGITRRPGMVYLSDGTGSANDFREIVHRLSTVYQTSTTATRIRIQELGLLHDGRQSSTPFEGQVTMPQALSQALQDLLAKRDSPSETE